MTIGLSDVERAVLAMIREAINRRHPCPSNAVIAAAIGRAGLATAAGILARLEQKGLITVERFNRARIVTDNASGRCTEGDRTVAPHWRETRRNDHAAPAAAKSKREYRSHNPAPPFPIDQLVDRDPCPRCGVRRDVGCRHHPS